MVRAGTGTRHMRCGSPMPAVAHFSWKPAPATWAVGCGSGAGVKSSRSPHQEPSTRSASTATPPVSVEARIRAEAPSLSFRPLVPGDASADRVAVTSRSGGRDPRTGGDARLLQIELTDQVGALLALIIEGPAGCCVDYARPDAIPNVS